MQTIKNISTYMVCSAAIVGVASLLESSFLSDFLNNNITSILINLLAINTATSSIVLTKLKEIADKNAYDFSASYSELKKALFEQIILIVVAVLILMCKKSVVIKAHFLWHDATFDIAITTIFIYALDTLRDTGKAIFIIVSKKN